MAVEKEGAPVLLHTDMANDVAEFLLRRRLIPGWEDAEIVRREVVFRESRFDFALRRDGKEMVLDRYPYLSSMAARKFECSKFKT